MEKEGCSKGFASVRTSNRFISSYRKVDLLFNQSKMEHKTPSVLTFFAKKERRRREIKSNSTRGRYISEKTWHFSEFDMLDAVIIKEKKNDKMVLLIMQCLFLGDE
jgi:hypothetical protein